MGRLVFLDVGGNQGQSIEAALTYDFDVIYSFEPVAIYYEMLRGGVLRSDHDGHGHKESLYDQTRVVICPFGLWVKDEVIAVHSPHTMAASVFADHEDGEGGSVDCDFVSASRWLLDNVTEDDYVVMKLNCEGSECTIVDHLVDSRTIHLVDHLMIDFDCYKIPSQVHRPSITINKMVKYGVDFVMCDDVMHGFSHYDRMCHWLDTLERVSKNE